MEQLGLPLQEINNKGNIDYKKKDIIIVDGCFCGLLNLMRKGWA
jgi:hypothetical protein